MRDLISNGGPEGDLPLHPDVLQRRVLLRQLRQGDDHQVGYTVVIHVANYR